MYPVLCTVCHGRDTCLFGDMELYTRFYPMDVTLLLIGGVFTMDKVLAQAVGETVEI